MILYLMDEGDPGRLSEIRMESASVFSPISSYGVRNTALNADTSISVGHHGSGEGPLAMLLRTILARPKHSMSERT